jgi:cell division transport system permease protein
MTSRQDLPLKSDIAARFVPKIVALMVYLGTLSFVFTLFLIQKTYHWEKQFTTQLSIEVPTAPGIASRALEERVLQILKQTPGIADARPVPQKEMEDLFASLLGQDVEMEGISLPIVIDVSLNAQKPVDLKSLTEQLKSIFPQIQIMDHREWQGQVSGVIQTTVVIASVITFLILLAALAVTTFATRTSLLIHRQIIEVLSLIGAPNAYIAKQFQFNALKQGFIASSFGSLFAFLTFYGMGILLEKAGLSLVAQSSFFFESLSIFLLVPLLTALLMMISARRAVMRELRL